MIHTMEGEKQSKPHKRSFKLLKFLPKAATSAVSFQNPPPFSPGRTSDSNINKRNVVYNTSSLDPNGNHHHHRAKSNAAKGFSGPLMVSIVPAEARRRQKDDGEPDFDAAEPASPKISCMGQIKKKKMNKFKAAADKARQKKRPPPPKKQVSAIRRIFGGGKPKRAAEKSGGGGKADDAAAELAGLPDRAPALSQMRRFASGREAFSGFDWSEVADVDADLRNCQSDDEKDHWGDEEEEEVRIPFSAPILLGAYGGGGVGGGGGGVKVQPRKEINLWKRRTMAPPRPLRLHPSDGDGDGKN